MNVVDEGSAMDLSISSGEWTRPSLSLAANAAAEADSTEPLRARTASGVQAKTWTHPEEARLKAMVASHFDFIWRSLRRLGVPPTDVDDCAQQVFWVAARKLNRIEANCERAFLFSTALRVASDARRSRTRRREVCHDELAPLSDPGPSPDEIADQRRARKMLDTVLESMPMDLRAVFVLFELEEMGTQDIADLLELPPGTVASRLRRAREEFQRVVARVRAREAFRGGGA
jgi:RNA polymerase sigma-70 factor, ECF subfamily